MTNGIVNCNGSLETQFASLGINGTKSAYVPPHLRNAQRAASSPSPSPSMNGYVVWDPAPHSAVDRRSIRTGWNDPRASPRGGHEPLRGGHNERGRPSGFGNSVFGSPRSGGAANDWAGRPSANGWSPRESRDGPPRDISGAGVWRNGAHVVGSRNMRLEKELFGDASDPSKQHTGINFEKYDDIPVEATGAGVPEPVTTFTNPPLDPVLLENIAFARYTTPTPVQKYSIPIVAANRDLMACAQTGSGKTGGFLFPILSASFTSGPRAPPAETPQMGYSRTRKAYPTALILAPTPLTEAVVVVEVAEVVVATATSANQAARTVAAGDTVDTVAGEDTEEHHLMVVMAEAEIAMAMVDPVGGKKNFVQDSTQPSLLPYTRAMHHQGSSPAFDAPEFPPLRRLKPLPKRRRTSDLAAQVSEPDDLIQPMADLLGSAESLAEELIARADSLSSQMALQSYYSSVLGSGDITRSVESEAFDPSAVYQRFAEGLGSGKQDEDHSEGDYTDHLQQPGNTKKRKVPANISGSVNGREVSLPLSVEEEMSDSMLSTRRLDQDLDILVAPPSSMAQLPKKGKISPSTLAGLQHKELLKHRKRQLAAVLGALSLGDALALDQALSTHLPFVSTMFSSDSTPPKVRLSRRRGPRLARAAAAQASARRATQKGVSFPAAQFTFTFPSATSDRLIATKEEVLVLRSRFEAELARQAARAVKAATEAKQAALAASRASRTNRSSKTQPSLAGGDQSGVPLDLSPSGKSRGSKKKKRNALAIASNPHHRNNYVPSRLPSSGHVNPVQATLNAQNSLGPQPLRFLSAELPPRRRKKKTVTPRAQIVNPADEWICPRCEYSLFYGDGSDYRRAIRDRKQILRRRRRAQERAAGGLGTTKNPAKPISDEEGDDDDDESAIQSAADMNKATSLVSSIPETPNADSRSEFAHTSFVPAISPLIKARTAAVFPQTGSSYDYSSYPTTPFEHTAPPTQASGRAVRSNTSQTQSPQQQPGFQPSPPYASSTTYPSASYGISSAHAQQWQQDSWASQQYAQPFTSQSMQAEMTYTPTAPRSDAPPPVSTPDTRASGFPPSSLPPPHESRRQDSGYSQSLPTSSHNSSPPRTRRREKTHRRLPPPSPLMQDSYRLIMDNANNMVASGTFSSRSPPVESVERMLQSANYGVQALQSATAQSNPDVRPTAGVGDKDAPASKRQKGEEHAQEGQTCLGCNATSTPEWRRGPLGKHPGHLIPGCMCTDSVNTGPRTLCNACGLVYAKLLKKRARGEARSRAWR
ncbi:hypothetical protein J3R83DRAFT_8068 [Lanmaoa asiatica]|nr:hypothetical protein J3R83DRAFT_8068 [Lanmaoa asiatica]